MAEVSLAEACRVLGLSRRTVERRLAAGELQGRKVGGKWRVDVPAYASDAPVTRHDAPDAPDAPLAELAELTRQRDDLTRQVAELTRQLDALAGERDYLRQLSAALTSKIPPALPAPSPEASAPIVDVVRRRWRWPWARS